MYPCQALPGSPMHTRAKAERLPLPDSYAGYAFLSYDAQPLPNAHLSSAEILRFRDEVWHTISPIPPTSHWSRASSGRRSAGNVEEMARMQLRRRLFEEPAGAEAVNY